MLRNIACLLRSNEPNQITSSFLSLILQHSLQRSLVDSSALFPSLSWEHVTSTLQAPPFGRSVVSRCGWSPRGITSGTPVCASCRRLDLPLVGIDILRSRRLRWLPTKKLCVAQLDFTRLATSKMGRQMRQWLYLHLSSGQISRTPWTYDPRRKRKPRVADRPIRTGHELEGPGVQG